MTTTVTIHHTKGEGVEAQTFVQSVGVGDVALDKVLFDFNVTGDPRVTILKALSAAQIQMMLDHQTAEKAPAEAAATPEEKASKNNIKQARMRAASVAITQTELTQMALVKALFAKA